MEDGRVAAVGSLEAVRRASPTGTDVVDLAGGLVVPGLADAHLHLGEIARERAGVDLGAVRSLAELRERLADYAQRHATPAIVGRGLDLERLAERRWPTAEELDGPVADRPVVLFHASGHAAVLNTAALERAFGGRARPVRSAAEASVLLEDEQAAVRPLVDEALPLTAEALRASLVGLAGCGLTTVGTMNTHARELDLLRELADGGRLPIRVRAYPPLRPGAGDAGRARAEERGRLAVVGVKGFLDGAFGPRTASLSEPYADAPGLSGIDREDDRELADAIAAATAEGLAPALHAIGDRAVGRAVRLTASAAPVAAPARIEHASLTPPAVLRELARARPLLVVQPGFVLSDWWLGERLGPARSRWAYVFRSLAELGVPLAGSSDAPYDTADPWRGMRAAVDRRDELGRSANSWPDQALTAPEALALYTEGAHRALGLPERGRLAPGAPADLVVLTVPRLDDALRTGSSAVRETWVDGRRLDGAGSGAEARR